MLFEFRNLYKNVNWLNANIIFLLDLILKGDFNTRLN